MFEALPVVIPTLHDVARGTLRHGTAADAAEAAPDEGRTAAILLDAHAPTRPALGALYDELELYLQAANIASLRIHRRGKSSVTQMLDILASVTLLRSHGCERVILIVAAEGAIPSWERSRAETLASLVDLVRRQHSDSAQELISAIADLVKTIRIVADSVAGVATILLPAPGAPAVVRSRAAQAGQRPSAAPRDLSPASAPASSPPALMLPLRAGRDHVSAMSELYLWCRALAGYTPETKHAPDDTAAREAAMPARVAAAAAVTGPRIAREDFYGTMEWLSGQWNTLVDDLAREAPPAAAHAPAAPAGDFGEAARQSRTAAQRGQLAEQTGRFQMASRAAWPHLDASVRVKWLDLCRQGFASLSELTPAITKHDGRSDCCLALTARVSAPA